MAKQSELVTKIILKGQNDPSLKKAFQTANNLTDKSLDKMRDYGRVVANAMKVTSVAVGGALAAAAKVAIDYESAFAGVMKTVNETSTTTYEDLSNSIRDMSKRMPASVEEISAVAEAAGQLGIKADDIMKFTEVMINLGETTNISSDEAASTIAKLFNITGTSMDMVDRFGATLVHLGNNAATTENDIMNMASRIASSAVQIGMSEQELLALATTLSSVGLEAEAGGTAISTIMSEIDKSVALSSEDLATWAETANMSVSEFKTLWGEDAYGAMQKIISGMSDFKTEGGNLNILLDELGISNVRTSDTMKRLASASEMMGNMTGIANEAWEQNSALTEEARKRYETVASKIQILKNTIGDVGITIGNELLPYIQMAIDKLQEIDWEAVAKKITDAIDWVIDHADLLIQIIGTLAGAFIAFKVGKFLKTMFDSGKAIMGVIKACGKSKLITTFGNTLGKLGSKASSATKGLGKVKGGIQSTGTQSGASAGQILASAAAFIALGAGIALAAGGFWILSQAAIALTSSGWGAVAVMFGMVGALAALAWGASVIGASLTAGSLGFLAFGAAMLMAAGAIWIIAQAAEGLKVIFESMATFISSVLQGFGDMVQSIFEGIGSIIESVGNVITSIIDAVAGVFDSMGQAALNAGLGFEALARGLQLITNMSLWDLGKALVAVGGSIGGLIIACGGIDKIGTGMQSFATGLMMVVTVGNSALVFLTLFPIKMQMAMTQGANNFSLGMNRLPLIASTTLAKLNTTFKTYSTMISLTSKMMVISIVKNFEEGKPKAFTAGQFIGQGLAEGIRSKIEEVKIAAQEIAAAADKAIQAKAKIASPSKVTTQDGAFMGQGVAVGIEKEIPNVYDISTKMASVPLEAMQKVGVTNVINNPTPTITPLEMLPREFSYPMPTPSNNESYNINITFAPVVNGGNAEENKRIIREEEEEFERRMDAYFEKKERLSFNV